MNNGLKRVITACLTGSLFFGSFLFSLKLFLLILCLITACITFIEWPTLIGGMKNWRFWVLTWFYPLLPCISLIIFVFLTYQQSKMLALYPFGVAWIHDTAAYVTGTFFGRHKLVPRISPKKTWEGLFGGFVGVLLFHYAMRWMTRPDGLLQSALTLNSSKGYLQAAHSEVSKDISGIMISDYRILLVWALVGTLLAFTGDLFISKMKRRAQLKDTGALLPGHGGLLDRFDSVLFVGFGIGIWLIYALFECH